MEWIDGIKLTDDVGLKMAGLNRKKLIDQVLGANSSFNIFVQWQFSMICFSTCATVEIGNKVLGSRLHKQS